MAFGSVFNAVISVFFSNLAPYHLLLYSTLLGTELYQSFVNTKVCYRALPRSAFTTLQKRIFPIYFVGQTTLIFLTAITFPPLGVQSLIHHKADWICFAVAGVTAALNTAIYGPRTQRAMVACIHQETRDMEAGAAGLTSGPRTSTVGECSKSAEMQRLRRAFSRNHAMSIHMNLISIAAMVIYGWRLALRMSVDR